MLKIAKNWPNFALSGQFWLQSDFFASPPPPSDFVPVGDRRGPKILSPPPINNLEEKTLYSSLWDTLKMMLFTKCLKVNLH